MWFGGPKWSDVNRGTIGVTNGMPIWVENGLWQPWVKLQSVVLSEFVVKVSCGDGKVLRTIRTQSTIHWITSGNEPDRWKGIKSTSLQSHFRNIRNCNAILQWTDKVVELFLRATLKNVENLDWETYVLSPTTRASSVSCSMRAQTHWEYSKRCGDNSENLVFLACFVLFSYRSSIGHSSINQQSKWN